MAARRSKSRSTKATFSSLLRYTRKEVFMNMSIFRIAQEYEDLARFPVETEEDAKSYEERFLALDAALEKKVEAIAAIKRDSEGCILALKTRIADDKKEIERHEKRIERMKALATLACHLATGGKIKTAYAEAYLIKSDAVVIVDESAIPDEYIREKVIREPDKALARKALLEGYEVPGFALERRESACLK